MPGYSVEHNMTNHPPKDDHVVHLFEELRKAFKATAAEVVELCPESREKSLALAVASVARNQADI